MKKINSKLLFKFQYCEWKYVFLKISIVKLYIIELIWIESFKVYNYFKFIVNSMKSRDCSNMSKS